MKKITTNGWVVIIFIIIALIVTIYFVVKKSELYNNCNPAYGKECENGMIDKENMRICDKGWWVECCDKMSNTCTTYDCGASGACDKCKGFNRLKTGHTAPMKQIKTLSS